MTANAESWVMVPTSARLLGCLRMALAMMHRGQRGHDDGLCKLAGQFGRASGIRSLRSPGPRCADKATAAGSGSNHPAGQSPLAAYPWELIDCGLPRSAPDDAQPNAAIFHWCWPDTLG